MVSEETSRRDILKGAGVAGLFFLTPAILKAITDTVSAQEIEGVDVVDLRSRFTHSFAALSSDEQEIFFQQFFRKDRSDFSDRGRSFYLTMLLTLRNMMTSHASTQEGVFVNHCEEFVKTVESVLRAKNVDGEDEASHSEITQKIVRGMCPMMAV